MKKIILAAAVSALMTGSAFAQATNQNAPQPSSDGRGINQPGTSPTGVAIDRPDSNAKTEGMAKSSSMKKDGMTKDKMSK